MAIFPCENKGLCLDPATPFANFSAELPDQVIYLGRSTGFSPSYPPLGSDFTAVGCTTFCESTVSQQEADLCAARDNVLCLSGVWPVATPGVDVFGNPVPVYHNRPVFFNRSQTATVFCPDGNPFAFTVPPGRYASFDQQQSDAAALSDAQTQAALNLLCIGNLANPQTCSNQPYADSVTASGNFLSPSNACWEIFGSLPPGINSDLDLTFGCNTADTTLHFFGTPTVPGDYTFGVQVSDGAGNFMLKTVTLRVMGITTTTLPDGVPFTPYSEQVLALGVTNPIFTLESGTLPQGLSLDAGSGTIFGTPIQSETKDFVISVTEAGTGITCVGPQLEIKVVGGINFNDIVWNPINLFPGDGTASGSNLNNHAQGSVTQPAGFTVNQSSVGWIGSFNYTGDLVNCNLHVVITGAFFTGNPAQIHGGFNVNQDFVPIVTTGTLTANGVFDFPFTVIAGVASVIDVFGNVTADATGDIGPCGINIAITITPAF